MRRTWALAALSGGDLEPVDDVGDAGRVPSRVLGFSPRHPGVGGPVQVDRGSGVADGDPGVVDDSVALQRLLDAVGDITRDGATGDGEVVVDPQHAVDPAD